jgi:hypothetical protein
MWQSTVYLTYSTTESESEHLYHVGDSTIDLLSTWGSVGMASLVRVLSSVPKGKPNTPRHFAPAWPGRHSRDEWAGACGRSA